MTDFDRVKGCLFGTAIGDALGYPIEFLFKDEIKSRFGMNGFTLDSMPSAKPFLFSDDTQMTLFTAMGLVNAVKDCKEFNMDEYVKCVYNAYQDWYRTQTEEYKGKSGNTSLFTIGRLWRRMAPGSTCMNSLQKGVMGTLMHPINESKGCGGVMRVAPVGMLKNVVRKDGEDEYKTREKVDMLGAKLAATTHGHPMAFIPSALHTDIIYGIFNGESDLATLIDRSIMNMSWQYSGLYDIGAFITKMKMALDYAIKGKDDSCIEEIGEGWIGDEAIAIAIYCAVKYQDDFNQAIYTAINHEGDSDSTGAITGGILGAFKGYEAIPHKMVTAIDDHMLLNYVSEEVYKAFFEKV